MNYSSLIVVESSNQKYERTLDCQRVEIIRPRFSDQAWHILILSTRHCPRRLISPVHFGDEDEDEDELLPV